MQSLIAGAPEGVEATLHEKDGQEFLFVLNHNADPVAVDFGERGGIDLLSGREIAGAAELPDRDLWIVRR